MLALAYRAALERTESIQPEASYSFSMTAGTCARRAFDFEQGANRKENSSSPDAIEGGGVLTATAKQADDSRAWPTGIP
jgi:hypothetical protein